MKNFFIILAMKILNFILKIFHKHGGNFLGRIAFKWNPEIFKYFKVNCPVIAVSATNGKTMTNNAINYTGDDLTVTIEVIERKKTYLVNIIDTGKGIKEEDLPYIWDKYYKNKKKHKRNLVGTGLGLSIVKNVLQLHEYDFGVKSEQNKGSCFYFKIPIAKEKHKEN